MALARNQDGVSISCRTITVAINFFRVFQLWVLITSSKRSNLTGTATDPGLWPKAETRVFLLISLAHRLQSISQSSQVIYHPCPSDLLLPVSEVDHWYR